MKDFDCANGWAETPEEVKRCEEAQKRGEVHAVIEQPGQWRCTHIVTCPTCGYTYWYDSSG